MRTLKWKCYFSFQTGAVTVCLPKVPLSALKFQVVSNFSILGGYTICPTPVLFLSE